MRSRRNEAAKATTRKEVALESLKTVLAIKGDARTHRTRTARAIVVTSLRLVLATAPAVEGSLLPILVEMKRVVASGRASWVMSGECGGCCGEKRYFSDLGEVEDSDQDDVVDERAGVDDQLLSRYVRGSSGNVEDRGCLRQWSGSGN